MQSTFEQEQRELICEIGRMMHRGGFIDGTAGNISVRLGEDRFLLTPSGLGKAFMQPEQMIIINSRGERVDEPNAHNAELKPSSETPMHLEAYRQRPDVNAVIHAHPAHAIAMSFAGLSMQTYTIPESILLLGTVPNLPYSTPASTENRDAISQAIQEHDALVLAYHGSLTVGPDLWKAYFRLETLEHNARIVTLIHTLGGGGGISQEEIEKLLAVRRAFGLSRPGE